MGTPLLNLRPLDNTPYRYSSFGRPPFHLTLQLPALRLRESFEMPLCCDNGRLTAGDTMTDASIAPAWRRFTAIVYDALAVVAILMVVGLLAQFATGGHLVDDTGHLLAWWYQPLQGIVVGAYFLASWMRGGQTLGMRPWRIRVTDSHGQPREREARAGASRRGRPALGAADDLPAGLAEGGRAGTARGLGPPVASRASSIAAAARSTTWSRARKSGTCLLELIGGGDPRTGGG